MRETVWTRKLKRNGHLRGSSGIMPSGALAPFWLRSEWKCCEVPGPSRTCHLPSPLESRSDLVHLCNLYHCLPPSVGVTYVLGESYSICIGREQVCFSRFWVEKGYILLQASFGSLMKRLEQGANLEYLLKWPGQAGNPSLKENSMGCLLFPCSVLAKWRQKWKTDLFL